MIKGEKMMLTNLKDTTTLSNGVKMPWLGLGVFKVDDGEEVIHSVMAAIRNGYISIDTAAIYENEEGVGQAIRESGIPREELFITSKLWNADQGYESTLKAFEKLYKEGRVRAIGVSNFHIHHLQDLISSSEIKPMVNQVEFHPHLTQKDLLAYCQKEGIQLEAWSPLKRGQLINNPVIEQLAHKYNKSVAQIILRWDLQHGVVTIPKSIKEHRIIENANVFDFELSQQDMDKIDGLNEDSRAGSNPDTMMRGF